MSSPGAAESVDTVALGIAWSRLVSIVEEAATVLRRTAFSQVLRESFDYTCVLLTPDGQALAQSSRYTLPGFVRAASSVTRCFTERWQRWEQDDVAVTNDPWLAAGHLHDLAVAVPVLLGDTLVGFSVNIAHQADMGGRGYSADARSLYEEGLLIPPLKLVTGGRRDEALVELLLANVRLPETVLNDVDAQVAAARLAAERLGELLEGMGLDSLEPLAVPILYRSEAAMREAIATLTPGRFANEFVLDAGDEPVTLRAAVSIGEDSIVVDFSDCDPQVERGINSSFNYTYGYAAYAVKAVLEPNLPNNDGAFRPIEVVAPPGSVVNCTRPAPVSARGLVGHAIVPLVLGALVPAAPDRVMAEPGAPAPRLSFFGSDDAGRDFHTLLLTSAGLGARSDRDGHSCKAFPTNTSLASIEIIETTMPLRFDRRKLLRDSGGPGRFRGGLGQEIVVRNAASTSCTVATTVERVGSSPAGLFGGGPGTRHGIFGGAGEALPPQGRVVLGPGERIVVRTAGGGGWGDPRERDPELVRRDVANGYVSAEAAETAYACR